MADKYIDLSYNTAQGSITKSTHAAAITGASEANPCVITAVAHGFSDGDIVQIDGCAGMVEINDRSFTVANKAADTFELTGVDSSGYTTWTSGGVATKLMAVTGEVRVMYDAALAKDRIVDAIQKAKEHLAVTGL